MSVNDLFARTGSFFKWDEPTRVDAQLADESAEAKIRREVYGEVTLREQFRCRICRAWCTPSAPSLLEKGHHHHIVYASAGGPTTTANVCLLCAKCHNDEHRHRIAIEGNADVALTVSRRRMWTNEWYISAQETSPGVWERD
jgi:5-methylcytosine-specific restriction endonuclease McrA